MFAFDECGVLIPASTLEDFPSDLSDYDARSLLAAWTVLWHPRLLVAGQCVPTWYRADDPPEPTVPRILAVPHPSLAQLPAGYQDKFTRTEQGRWISGSDRLEMLTALGLEESLPPLQARYRKLGVEDFYAAGFAALQVQVMTRRLRYTSNLDEIHLQNRIVAAAEAFLDGQSEPACEALHDVFDCLAEERDHYFASDPHLIDLNLVTESTITSLIDAQWQSVQDAQGGDRPPPIDPSGSQPVVESSETAASRGAERPSSLATGQSEGEPLPTPRNLLIDHAVADQLVGLAADHLGRLRELIESRQLGWAGGGPPPEICLDLMTYCQAGEALRESHRQTAAALGRRPTVYARFSGGTPADLTPELVQLGYIGLIPLDFAGGSGFGDEAKVIQRAGGVEIEALTAKPIDAASDASFLAIGPRLGESIDSGEVATGLLVHWPGQTCASFDDLRRVASWSLVLGKFWNLEDYFRDGEHPYHHGEGQAVSATAPESLNRRLEVGGEAPLASLAEQFCRRVRSEAEQKLAGLAALLSDSPAEDAASTLAAGIGLKAKADNAARLIANPHSVGCRVPVEVGGRVSTSGKHVYGVSTEGGRSIATVDVPACGFAWVDGRGGQSAPRSWLRRLGLRRPAPLAEQHHLMNEFMEVTLSPESGGVSAVYSGSARGNRFSLRLVAAGGGKLQGSMRCRQLKVIAASPAVGSILASGDLVGDDDRPLARFEWVYRLERGSRVLNVRGKITAESALGNDPWKDYLAARVAVANESAICRLLLRDKLHRPRGRRLVAPLGVVLDEAERQTLISAAGSPYHLRVGDRFLDTLLNVAGESTREFELNYGFDIASPVEVAKSLIYPPPQLSVSASDAAAVGWLVHTSPKELIISSLQTRRLADGRRASWVRLIQTRPASCTASVRFVYEIETAGRVDLAADDPFEVAGKQKTDATFTLAADRVSLPMAGHQIVDLMVVFRS